MLPANSSHQRKSWFNADGSDAGTGTMVAPTAAATATTGCTSCHKKAIFLLAGALVGAALAVLFTHKGKAAA